MSETTTSLFINRQAAYVLNRTIFGDIQYIFLVVMMRKEKGLLFLVVGDDEQN